MAGEQREHLSSYLYDAAAVALSVAEAFTTAGVPPHSHPFVFCPVQLRSATVSSTFMDTSACECEAWLLNMQRNKSSSHNYVHKTSRIIEFDLWFSPWLFSCYGNKKVTFLLPRLESSHAPMKAMNCKDPPFITARFCWWTCWKQQKLKMAFRKWLAFKLKETSYLLTKRCFYRKWEYYGKQHCAISCAVIRQK